MIFSLKTLLSLNNIKHYMESSSYDSILSGIYAAFVHTQSYKEFPRDTCRK